MAVKSKTGPAKKITTEKVLEVTRRELKYQMNPVQYVRLSQALKNVMIEDKHNGDAGYRIRSLYFDSFSENDFYQKLAGDENRKKIRIRTYDYKSNKVKLEIKRKFNDDQVKKSAVITKADAQALINCDYDVLLKYENSTANMIYQIMHVNRVRPVVMVEYNRRAFIYPTNNIRITLDTDIRSSETNFNFFDKELQLYPIEPFAFALAEVKYDGFLMRWITELLSCYDLNRSAYSKYLFCRSIYEQFLA